MSYDDTLDSPQYSGEVASGTYCAQAAIGNVEVISDEPFEIIAGDPADDDETLTVVVGVADLETAGPDCADADGNPMQCVDTDGQNMSVVITLIPVEGPDADCSTDPAAYADGIEANYDVAGDSPAGTSSPLHSWEAVVAPGWYCAMADKDDAIYPDTSDLVSIEPFEVTANDPENDWDEDLGEYLDVSLNISLPDGSTIEAAGYEIEIYQISNGGGGGSFTCVASAGDPDFVVTTVGDDPDETDVAKAQQVVNVPPTEFCAQVQVNYDDGTTAYAGSAALGANLETDHPGDPAGDNDITLNVTLAETGG